MMSWKTKGFIKKKVRWTYLIGSFLCLALFFSIPIYATDFASGKAAYLDGNYEDALKIFKPLAKEGNSEAEYYIELIEKTGYRSKSNYQEGKEAYLKNDFKRALEILKPLAEDGDSWSQYILSLMYESGQGVEKNQEESIKWLILAAESGVPKIQYDLGIRYFYGYGVEKNYSEAAKWWESSANAGIADSQYNLGLQYYRGIGIPKDKKKARLLIEKAAKQDHGKAQHRLAMIYALDDEDFTTSLIWLKKSAQQNNVEAQYNLGVFHERGYGVAKSLNKAKEWFQLAADQGLELAIDKIKEINNKESEVDLSFNNKISEKSKENLVPEKTEKTKKEYNLTNWLNQQQPGSYTLQLASVVKREDIINFIEKENFKDQVGYIEVTVNGITRYAAIYGLYSSYDDAKKASLELPPNLNTTPWVRKIGVVKEILKK